MASRDYQNADFHRFLFPATRPDTDGIACIVTGLDGRVEDFETPRQTLQAAGYKVAVYEYGMDVLKSGDPDNVRDLTSNITADFQALSSDYPRRRHTGVSLGALIAHNMHLWDPTAEPSLLATPGVPLAETIFHAVMLRFLRIPSAYKRNGYGNIADLVQAFDGIDIDAAEPPTDITGAVIALGTHDLTIPYHKAVLNMTKWQAAGVPIEFKRVDNASHDNTISWFKQHIPEMLQLSEKLETLNQQQLL